MTPTSAVTDGSRSPSSSSPSSSRSAWPVCCCSSRPVRGESFRLVVAAFCHTPLLSIASFLHRTPYLLTTPFFLASPLSLTTGLIEPLVRRQLVGKAPHIQSVLSRGQFDVLVRIAEVPGISHQRNAPRGGCKRAEVLDQSVSLELKYRLRQTHRDQDARVPDLAAGAEKRLEKEFRFVNRLAGE